MIGDSTGVVTDALWAGTFHGIGARLLRDYAEEIGTVPACTIPDREGSAEVMNLMRHELVFSKMQNRFPAKGTCLAIYSRCVNAELPIEDVLATSLPWCAAWAVELKQLFVARMVSDQPAKSVTYQSIVRAGHRMEAIAFMILLAIIAPQLPESSLTNFPGCELFVSRFQLLGGRRYVSP
jgi:DNA helicase II / ATP-dependent DNA helicase PcrA